MSQADIPASVQIIELSSLKKELRGCLWAAQDALGRVEKARAGLVEAEKEYSALCLQQEQVERSYVKALLEEIDKDSEDEVMVRSIMDGTFTVDRVRLLWVYQECENILLDKSCQAVKDLNAEGLEALLCQLDSIVTVKKARDIRLLPPEVLENLQELLSREGSKLTWQDQRAAFGRARFLQTHFNILPEKIPDFALAAIKISMSVAGRRRCEIFC